jgi:hypothetical protein
VNKKIIMYRSAMHRWTARFALLVMLVPVVGPLALASVDPIDGMHCMRQPMVDAAASPAAVRAMQAMHCHGMQSAAQDETLPAPSQASVRSRDCCCNHDCCRSVATSRWAQFASPRSSYVSLLIEPALTALVFLHASSPLIGSASARAPPRS